MALMGTVRLKPLEKLRISGKGSSFSSPVKGRQTEHLEYGYSFSRQSQFCWLRKPEGLGFRAQGLRASGFRV